MSTGADRFSTKRLVAILRGRVWPWLTSALGWLVVLYVSATMLIKYDTDTTDISAAVFVAVAVLAGLAFTYAGVLPEGRERVDVIYAGESLSQACLVFLVASLLKHGTIVLPTQLAALSSRANERFLAEGGSDLVVLILQIVLFGVFVSGLLLAQLGYKILSRVLVSRTMDRQRLGGYFPPAE